MFITDLLLHIIGTGVSCCWRCAGGRIGSGTGWIMQTFKRTVQLHLGWRHTLRQKWLDRSLMSWWHQEHWNTSPWGTSNSWKSTSLRRLGIWAVTSWASVGHRCCCLGDERSRSSRSRALPIIRQDVLGKWEQPLTIHLRPWNYIKIHKLLPLYGLHLLLLHSLGNSHGVACFFLIALRDQNCSVITLNP